jgi:hypothetical protein
VSKVKELSVSLEGKGEDEKRGLLVKCAATSLNSKLVRPLQRISSSNGPLCISAGGGSGKSSARALTAVTWECNWRAAAEHRVSHRLHSRTLA